MAMPVPPPHGFLVWGPALRGPLGVPPAPPPDMRPGRAWVIREWVVDMLLRGWPPAQIKRSMQDMRGGDLIWVGGQPRGSISHRTPTGPPAGSTGW